LQLAHLASNAPQPTQASSNHIATPKILTAAMVTMPITTSNTSASTVHKLWLLLKASSVEEQMYRQAVERSSQILVQIKP